MKQENTRGGKRPNAGAPKKDNLAKTRTIRLTDFEWIKLKSLGGVNWIREELKKIKDINDSNLQKL
jgi:hypothetical protein